MAVRPGEEEGVKHAGRGVVGGGGWRLGQIKAAAGPQPARAGGVGEWLGDGDNRWEAAAGRS